MLQQKPPPLTAILATALEALRGVGAEVTSLALAQRLGTSRLTAFDRLRRLEALGLVTSRRIPGRAGHPAKVFRIREQNEREEVVSVKEQWEYDPRTLVLTSVNGGGRRLIAIRVRPGDADLILGLIGVARRAVADVHPFGCSSLPECGCIGCEARRLLDAIGGDA